MRGHVKQIVYDNSLYNNVLNVLHNNDFHQVNKASQVIEMVTVSNDNSKCIHGHLNSKLPTMPIGGRCLVTALIKLNKICYTK